MQVTDLDRLSAIDAVIHLTLNTEGFLAGGCVRDTIYGVEPKDYDFVILDRGWDHADVFEHMSLLSNRLSRQGIRSEVYQAYEQANSGELSSFQKMFYGCMKVYFPFGEVDVLYSTFNDIDVHVANHDCNLNECYLGKDGVVVGERVARLVFIKGVSYERKRYMSHKFDHLSNGAARL